jgi:hypothetical protein
MTQENQDPSQESTETSVHELGLHLVALGAACQGIGRQLMGTGAEIDLNVASGFSAQYRSVLDTIRRQLGSPESMRDADVIDSIILRICKARATLASSPSTAPISVLIVTNDDDVYMQLRESVVNGFAAFRATPNDIRRRLVHHKIDTFLIDMRAKHEDILRGIDPKRLVLITDEDINKSDLRARCSGFTRVPIDGRRLRLLLRQASTAREPEGKPRSRPIRPGSPAARAREAAAHDNAARERARLAAEEHARIAESGK